MEEARRRVTNDVTTETLSLDFLSLSDIGALLPELSLLPQLISLDLHGNELSSLPVDLSGLRELRVLNLEDNKFSAINHIVSSLKSLPKLIELYIDVACVEDENILVRELPKLQVLNGTHLNRAVKKSDIDEIPQLVAITQHDLESVGVIYGAAKALHGVLSPEEDKQLTHRFDSHVQRVMGELSKKLTDTHDPFLRQGELLLAKHELYDVCFQEVIQHAQVSSPDFGAILRKLRAVHKDLFHEFPGVLQTMRPHYIQRLSKAHEEVVRAEKESAMLLDAAEVLEHEAATHLEEKKKFQNESDVARRKLAEENARLYEESARLQQELDSLRSERSSEKTQEKSRSYSENDPHNVNRFRARVHRHSSPRNSAGKPRSQSTQSGTTTSKLLPLKQLKDYIDQIYVSKVKYDVKCHKARLPRETMEQHMYTFLNQKYGLKSLIISHGSSILQAVNRYTEDNDVVVFGKILRNEIDEEFRLVQQQLKETVEQLIREGVKARNFLKSDSAIDTLVRQKTSMASGTLRQDEWLDIIQFMYNKQDSEKLNHKLIEAAKRCTKQSGRVSIPGVPRKSVVSQPHVHGKQKTGESEFVLSPTNDQTKAPSSKYKVQFSLFMDIMLNFQLACHESFIRKFRGNFVKFDADHDGVISESDFRAFVRIVAPRKTESDIEDLLAEVDPWNHKQITYSQAIKCLSAELFQSEEVEQQLGWGSDNEQVHQDPSSVLMSPPPPPPPHTPQLEYASKSHK